MCNPAVHSATASTDTSARTSDLPPQQLYLLVASLVLANCIDQLDAYSIGVMLPNITASFGEANISIWLINGFLLTSSALVPLVGKLSDMYGRHIVLQASLLVFGIGSVLCAVSTSMIWLIAARVVQGIGAAGTRTLPNIVLCDCVGPRKRANYLAAFSVVETAVAVGAPVLGGAIIQLSTWRALFWVNVPIVLGSSIVLLFTLRKLPQSQPRPRLPDQTVWKLLDPLGALLITISITLLITSFTLTGTTLSFTSAEVLAPLVLSAFIAVLFVAHEKQLGDDAMIPMSMFINSRNFVIGAVLSFTQGCTIVVVLNYMPSYYQVVWRDTEAISGLRLAPGLTLFIAVATGIARYTSSQGQVTGGYKSAPFIGAVLQVLGYALSVIFFQPHTPYWVLLLCSFIFSLGSGLLSPYRMLLMLNAVPSSQLAAAVTTQSLISTLAPTIALAGVTAGISNVYQSEVLNCWPANASTAPPAEAYNTQQQIMATLGQAVSDAIYTMSFRTIWYAVVAIAAFDLISSHSIKATKLRESVQDDDDAEEGDEAQQPVDSSVQQPARAAIRLSDGTVAMGDLSGNSSTLAVRVTTDSRAGPSDIESGL